MMEELDKRVNYLENFKLCSNSGSCETIQSILNALNDELSTSGYSDRWYTYCDNPSSNCKSLKRDIATDTMYSGTEKAKKVYAIQYLVGKASSSTEANSFKKVTDYIRLKFNEILTDEIGILTTFRNN